MTVLIQNRRFAVMVTRRWYGPRWDIGKLYRRWLVIGWLHVGFGPPLAPDDSGRTE